MNLGQTMIIDPSIAAGPLAPPARPVARAGIAPFQDDPLLHPSIFGPDPTPAEPAPAVAAAEPVATLKIAVKGLKPVERQLLEGLVKVSQRRRPRLQILDEAHAGEADTVLVDAGDPKAMAWAHRRPWLAGRAVIWIDGSEAAPGHTLLRRPVQWPILPMVLARALEAASRVSNRATAPATGRQAPQILIVDDSLAVRAQLRSVLEPCGYAVTDADSVEVALQSLARRKFDCVLMDVLMPGIDGYEGCHRIKARLRGADAVPVVILTSKGSAFDRIRGKMAGCDAYLTKPVDPQHLIEVVAQQVSAVPVRRIGQASP